MLPRLAHIRILGVQYARSFIINAASKIGEIQHILSKHDHVAWQTSAFKEDQMERGSQVSRSGDRNIEHNSELWLQHSCSSIGRAVSDFRHLSALIFGNGLGEILGLHEVR
jgi:hypothetical protein